jgi:SPFH domain / Band 7 family
MRPSLAGGILIVVAIVAAILAYTSVFTVHQTRQALVLRLGNPVDVITEPGLHFKSPFVDSVLYIDKRILDLENPAQEIIASDKKRLLVDAFARYRIQDPLKFYQAVGSIDVANSRLSTLLNSALRRVLGESTFTQLVRDERAQLMARIREQMDREAAIFGITIVDVRIRRADLPEENSQAVYLRMQTEAMPSATASLPRRSAATRTSSPSTARCRPTRPGCAPTTPACCSSRIRTSFAISPTRWARAMQGRAVSRRRRRGERVRPPRKPLTGDVGFHGRARPGFRHRRHCLRCVSGDSQARDGEGDRSAGECFAARRNSVRIDWRHIGLAGARLT